MLLRFFIILLSICVLAPDGVNAQKDLNYYLQESVRNSSQIYAQKNLQKVNEVEIQRLKAEYLGPKISVNADMLMAPYFNNQGNFIDVNPAPQAIGYDPAITNGGLYAGLVTFNQPLLNHQRFRTYAQQMLWQNQTYQFNNFLTQHDLERTVTDQYLLAYRDQQQIINSRQIVKLLSEQLLIAQQLVRSGTIAQADYLLLRIEQKARQGDLLNYETALYNDLIALDTLSGITIQTDTVILAKPEILLNESIDSASHFLRQYHLDSLRLTSDQRINNLIYQPQISFQADGGLNATMLPNLGRRVGFSAGLSLRWLIFDGHQKKFNQQKTALMEENVSFQRNRFVNTNRIRKQKLLQAINLLDSRIGILDTQVNDYEKVIEEYRKLLATGQFSVINFINTLKAFILLKNDLILAQSDRLTLINNFNYWNW